ncbi:unnamed protein product [Blepharisma stoltei]|uniref:Uncharacterized protein n=1 Tax=Blepharisma stoltei TaxID=1481888 RepID=A0AAU9ITJ4_9CILI|nr:unnamed protein product [Blepharisma stoltei]
MDLIFTVAIGILHQASHLSLTKIKIAKGCKAQNLIWMLILFFTIILSTWLVEIIIWLRGTILNETCGKRWQKYLRVWIYNIVVMRDIEIPFL